MAGDWIKMRGSLSSHPKVLRIAALIENSPEIGAYLSTGFSGCLSEIVTRDVTRDITLASLLRVWSATNEHTSDGVWHGLKPSDLDHIAGLPGFGAAMEAVGWAKYDPHADTTTMPDFLSYNSPAKGGRTSAAERQRRYRERHKGDANSNVTRDVTAAVTSNVEKRREEKKKPIELPDWVPQDAWSAFVEMRKKGKAPFTDHAERLALAKLTELRAAGSDPRRVIEAAVLNGWKSFYEPKDSARPAAQPWDGAQ